MNPTADGLQLNSKHCPFTTSSPHNLLDRRFARFEMLNAIAVRELEALEVSKAVVEDP